MRDKRYMDLAAYRRQFPRAEKWLVTCLGCGRAGYRPDMPRDSYRGLRSVTEPLELDQVGLCDYCANADAALWRAWNLGIGGAGWTDAVFDEAERLLPTLLEAGYAATNDEAQTWAFTSKAVGRAEQLEAHNRATRLKGDLTADAEEKSPPGAGIGLLSVLGPTLRVVRVVAR
jgi:hypothetical protein